MKTNLETCDGAPRGHDNRQPPIGPHHCGKTLKYRISSGLTNGYLMLCERCVRRAKDRGWEVKRLID